MTLDDIVTLADFRVAMEQSPDGVDYLDNRRRQVLFAAVGWVEEQIDRVLIDRTDRVDFEPSIGLTEIRIPDVDEVAGVTYLPESDGAPAARTTILVDSRVDGDDVSVYPTSGEWPMGHGFQIEVDRGAAVADIPTAMMEVIRSVVMSHALGSFSDTLNATEQKELVGRLRPYRKIPLAT